MTLSSPSKIQQLELENTTTCESQSQQSHNLEKTGQKYIKNLQNSRQGDAAELIAVLAAWKRGAEVFRNVGCTGKTDIVLQKPDGSLLAVDVKSATVNGQGGFGANSNMTKATETVVLVHPYTEEVRWIKGKAPLGWEGFWE